MGRLKFETAQRDDEAPAKQAQVEDKGIIQKVDELLLKALTAGATAVHVEPGPAETRVRMRIEGNLQVVESLNAAIHAKVANRIKILGAMDITRNKIAQRGFFKVDHEGTKAECNAYVFPSIL